MNRSSMFLALLVAMVMTAQASAQREKLKPGDGAPSLDVEAWVGGDPVQIEEGKVYVVVFWDALTAHGHASSDTVKGINRLREIYEENVHHGLIVLVVSPDDADRLHTMARQVEQLLGFTLAADRRNATRRAWVDEADIKRLPVAFIVGRDRNIAYFSNPREAQFATILDRVLKGRFDPRLMDKAEPMIEAARRARKVKNWRLAKMHYDEAIELDGQVFAGVALERFEMLIGRNDMHDPEAGYDYARQLLTSIFASDARALRDLAEKIALDTEIADEHRDLALAREAATAAMRLTGEGDSESLATLALVEFHAGNVDKAIEYQTRAWFIARPRLKPAYKRVLQSYQDHAARAGARTP